MSSKRLGQANIEIRQIRVESAAREVIREWHRTSPATEIGPRLAAALRLLELTLHSLDGARAGGGM